jgi:hypothetical protein
MNPPTWERDSHTLTACYEALREHVLRSAVCRDSVHGLALFMREGMAPWMDRVAKEPMRDAAIETAPRPVQIPDGKPGHGVPDQLEEIDGGGLDTAITTG